MSELGTFRRRLVKLLELNSYQKIIDEICGLNWSALTQDELMAVSCAYYFFSIQFRENLELACSISPWDEQLARLRREECDTDNLSPYPGVALPGESMNHDEFMWRVLGISPMDIDVRNDVERLGTAYLAAVRATDPVTRALSISSYEDGGLERVFRAILLAPDWNEPSLRAFQHFLVEHIRFDSDAEAGHGALSRHLIPDDSINPLWHAFRDLLVGSVPTLAT
jgi:hypothetical protein